MDDLPVPDFTDFLEQREASPSAVELPPTLLLETSRGCWWGAKHHCTFCGLNGGSMAFRSKSADRVLHEVEALLALGVRRAAVVDNILDMQYFRSLLPVLAERGASLSLFYEVKANLSRGQVRALAEAGVTHVQPGIESLSDSTLALMRKGTTALQNVQLLKWCKEYGVRPEWNLLYGLPGEDAREYDRMLPLLAAIRHLDPPSGQGPVRLDRFSPYHQDPAGHGMRSVRPTAPYAHLYRLPPDELLRVAYCFDFDHADGRELSYARPLLDRVDDWRASGPVGALVLSPGDDGTGLVVDSRSASPRGYSLEPWQRLVLEAMDAVAGERSVLAAGVEAGATEDAVTGFLTSCERLELALHVGDRWLALPVHSPARWTDRPQRRSLDLMGTT